MQAPNHRLSIFAHPPANATFAAYFLGAVLPLLGLGIVLDRYVFAPLGVPDELASPVFWRLPVLAAFLSMATLSLTCFFMLRRVVKQTLGQHRMLTSFDAVTGLPNRRLFKTRLEQAVRHAERDGSLVAAGFIDLDSFKRVNDTWGHATGDELLRQVGERLVGCLRMGDAVASPGAQTGLARLGGDEFTLLLTRVSSQEDVGRIARRVLRSLEVPFQVKGREIYVTASLGVAIYPTDGADAGALLRNADQAMYCAKERGRNNYQFHSGAMNESMERKAELEVRLRSALDREELLLFYQPVRDARSGELTGAEALLRWNDPEIGPDLPEELIALAEEIGLISRVGDWVLRTACAQARKWQDEGYKAIRIAVNVSGHQIRQESFVDTVVAALEETGISPALLDLEITESTIMQDDEVTTRTLHRLHELGLGLVLDDFGTGYSSLSYLQRFPVTRLKVDRSFIVDLATNRDDAALTSAIIAMAHGLRLGVVAESVENEEQVALLRELGCDELQGYLLGRPMSSEAFEHFLDCDKEE
jgi:diguanylate cyclase (GGDEF)-like protein